MLSLYLSVLLAILSHPSSSDDICTSTFTGNTNGTSKGGLLCNEYGFCSSCVSAGCSWCELTTRCEAVRSACTKHAEFGLTSIEHCTNEYANDNRERPDIHTTSYDPQLSEIMSVYARFAKDASVDEYPYEATKAKYSSTFTLQEDSIQVFTAKVTKIEEDECIFDGTNDLLQEICDVLDISCSPAEILHDFMYDIYKMLYERDAGALIKWTNIGLPIHPIKAMQEYIGRLIILGVLSFPVVNDFVMEDVLEEKFNLAFDDLGTHQMVVALDDVNEAIVVTFRGTENTEQYIGYLRHCFIDWDKSSLAQLKSDLGVSHDVHMFQIISNAYDELKSEFYSYVQELIAAYPEYQIFITGHSLGGALAAIFTLDLYADYYNNGAPLDKTKMKIYTYGQPRVGNDGFAVLMNELLDYEYYRVVHSKDPVPVLPPWIFGYRHNGIEIHYGEGDYVDNTLCQYRECTFLDPFEDTSCRVRYNDADWDDPIEIIGGLIDIFVELIFLIFTSKMTLNWDWEHLIEVSPGETGYYMDDLTTGFADEHASKKYGYLGEMGHCGAYNTAVKCTDQTADLDIDTENYRCVNPLGTDQFIQGVTNAASIIFDGGGVLDHLNGCGKAGDDMLCCLNTLRTGSTCVANDDHLVCPLTNVGEHCLGEDHCQDGFWNKASCEHGTCVADGEPLGGKCLMDWDCQGFNPFGQGNACCRGRCTEEQKDWAGAWVCPWICKKKWHSFFGTCYPSPDGSCTSFKESSNDCTFISDNWNLGIGTGDSKYAGTDSRIMFSYCIDRICSDWYQLDNCDHNDFWGSCTYEYFIVPNMIEDIQAAFEASSDVDLDFEFTTCGSKAGDGLQIDQIAIGHDGELVLIDAYEAGDDYVCIHDEGDHFWIDLDDSNRCSKIAVSWNGDNSASIYTSLISSRCYDDICDDDPGCAKSSNGCEVQNEFTVPLVPYPPVVDVPVVDAPVVKVVEISDKVMMLFIASMVMLLLTTMQNVSKCKKGKRAQEYQSVNMVSSSEF
eukprot:920060_1